MITEPNDMIITDYCAAMDRREISVNPKYQRSDQVWPNTAKSFLIETILLGYPIPKFYLHQITDLKSKKAIKEIVDGQQRSKTIHDFFNNRLRLSKNLETAGARGKNYDELHDDLKTSFLNYRLSIEMFVSAGPDDIRESFRRLNSYTVPLNEEEKRHAVFQGEFKWFVYEKAKEYENTFIELDVFSEKQLIRMQDAKLLADFANAFINGVQTTKSKQLNDLYKANDKAFESRDEISHRLRNAVDLVLSLEDLHGGTLMKPHIFLMLLIAASHVQEPSPVLSDVWAPPPGATIDLQTAAANLSLLASSLEGTPSDLSLQEFVAACTSGGSNVKKNREKMLIWMGRAFSSSTL
jgi:hypothetical protein